MTDHDFNRAILTEVAHRPWAMPAAPWVMTQTWHDVLFAHWPVDPGMLRTRLPGAFELDLFDGTGWLGIVPFRMTNVAPRGVPSLPWVSEFPELNVRTYVRVDDRPGVYFFSLDAGSALAVRAARTLFNLPYHSASMTVTRRDGRIEYDSRRDEGMAAPPRPEKPGLPEFFAKNSGSPNYQTPSTAESPSVQVSLSATYWPTGPVREAIGGSLEYFLIERYCLYNLDHRGTPYRLEIHHPPWLLQSAEAEFTRNTMADAAGVRLPNVKPLLHFASRQDTIAWAPSPL